MSSTKYGAVSGAVSRMRMLENITEHIAAARTPGYKKGLTTFAAKLSEAQSGLQTAGINYSDVTEEKIDFTWGDLEYTGSSLDLAINGDGFFQLERPDGTFGYARKGNFHISPEGVLMNGYGLPLMSADGGEIILPHSDVDIMNDGTIWDGETLLGQVGLFRFADLDQLSRGGDEMFVAPEGIRPEVQTEPQIIQRNLEASNVDMMRSISNITYNLRAFEANQKALKIYSDMSAKAAEIGALG